MRAGNVQKRNAFTLIELLVVIAIIVILMALTVGILSKVWQSVDETKTTVEVNKLAEAVNLFKGQFGRYPPSRIILSQVPGANPGSYAWGVQQGGYLGEVFKYSVEYLSSIFPGIDLSLGHTWSGTANSTAWYTLEGEECLVYFLGGMRYGSSGPQGFNTDKTNPTLNSTSARLGPFFPQFDESRIAYNSPNAANSGNLFPIYKDYYGSPYAYFIARFPGTNNYPNRYFPFVGGNPANIPNDCELLTTFGAVPFLPYFSGTVPPAASASQWPMAASFQFFKGDTFQIVSAGRDKLFGTGGQFSVQNPENSAFLPPGVVSGINPTPDQLKANYDNITNFTNGRLVPQ
jgi:prepilin-type N-terminal cleavage/methylation domain-containing protein